MLSIKLKLENIQTKRAAQIWLAILCGQYAVMPWWRFKSKKEAWKQITYLSEKFNIEL
nr:hypothetical protein [uncultured Flavobacterium sp.]